VVTISGGGGVGATAVAEFNPDSQKVTGITVTSPGYNYNTAPTVTITGGGGTAPVLDLATFGAVASGGLTKSGNGMLTLSGVNTYSGLTTISNGTLRLGVANALPTNAQVTVVNGVYDLNGFTVTNGSVTVISGSVVNGKLNSVGLTKVGDGDVTLGALQTAPAPIVIDGGTLRLAGAQSASLQAGLYEGRIDNNSADLTTPNPWTAIKLSTTNAYRFFDPSSASGGIWIDNSTYVYTGYLWNRSTTNENWTFCKAFDDTGWIKVDSTVVINNGTWNSYPVFNYLMTPGPHPFEVRLGQGSGGVGQVAAGNCPGVGFDPLGRGINTLCRRFEDLGDGSLLTYSLSFQSLTGTNQLATGSTVQVASNAVLNLGGSVQTLGGLSGSGLVTNGTLAVTGTVAPAGVGTIGTLMLATSETTLSGTLRVDVDSSGGCDVLAVNGNLDLTGMALAVENVSLLNPRLAYKIVTCTGNLKGRFASKNLSSGWVVTYQLNGDSILKNLGGTLIKLR
jgi:autotransporter-associated beta strand protein